MKWSFHIDQFTRVGESHVYKILTFEAEGDTLEEAYQKIVPLIPEGHRMWCCWSHERTPDEPVLPEPK